MSMSVRSRVMHFLIVLVFIITFIAGCSANGGKTDTQDDSGEESGEDNSIINEERAAFNTHFENRIRVYNDFILRMLKGDFSKTLKSLMDEGAEEDTEKLMEYYTDMISKMKK